MKIDGSISKAKPIYKMQSAKLSFEMRVIFQQFITEPTKWRSLKDEDKFHDMRRLNVNNKY